MSHLSRRLVCYAAGISCTFASVTIGPLTSGWSAGTGSVNTAETRAASMGHLLAQSGQLSAMLLFPPNGGPPGERP